MAAFFIPVFWDFLGFTSGRGRESGSRSQLRGTWQDITRTYLNSTDLCVRAIVYFVIWNLLSYLLSQMVGGGRSPSARDNTARFKAVSGPGLILYAFTISFAAIDWVMSIDPSGSRPSMGC